jgi:ubiquinone/menaquinone biosynthesis C-methylase UbiE
MNQGSPDWRKAERGRSQREQAHFEAVVEGGRELYWADRTAAAGRRQEIRSGLLLAASEADGEGRRILDVGCGTAAYTRPLARGTKATVVGVDIAPAVLRYALEGASSNLAFAAADVSCLPFVANCFNAVVGNAVLHHLPLEQTVPELLRVLKPGGRLCFAEPNFLNPQVFLERKLPWLRRRLENSPDETAFVRWSLRRRLQTLGMEAVTIRPFDFLYPLTPTKLIPLVEEVGRTLEQIPVVREIAGSLLIRARKPS